MPPSIDLKRLTHEQKDALILALLEQVAALTKRVEELEARLGEPPKDSGNSSVPPSKSQKPNRPEKEKRKGPRKGSLGRKGGGRLLADNPDQVITAKAKSCAHCRAALSDDDQVLHGRYDRVCQEFCVSAPPRDDAFCRQRADGRRRSPNMIAN